MTSDIAQYRLDALNRAKNRISSRILNDSIAHAEILIESMIGVLPAENDVVGIYSGVLPKDSFFDALNQTKAKCVQVIVDDGEDGTLAWLSELNPAQREKISVYKIDRPRPNHFFYITAGAFRFETNASNCTAEANFSEPLVVEKLEKAFALYLAGSTKLFPKE